MEPTTRAPDRESDPDLLAPRFPVRQGVRSRSPAGRAALLSPSPSWTGWGALRGDGALRGALPRASGWQGRPSPLVSALASLGASFSGLASSVRASPPPPPAPVTDPWLRPLVAQAASVVSGLTLVFWSGTQSLLVSRPWEQEVPLCGGDCSLRPSGRAFQAPPQRCTGRCPPSRARPARLPPGFRSHERGPQAGRHHGVQPGTRGLLMDWGPGPALPGARLCELGQGTGAGPGPPAAADLNFGNRPFRGIKEDSSLFPRTHCVLFADPAPVTRRGIGSRDCSRRERGLAVSRSRGLALRRTRGPPQAGPRPGREAGSGAERPPGTRTHGPPLCCSARGF